MPEYRLLSIRGQTEIVNTSDDQFVRTVQNALLEPGILCRRRPNTVTVSLTSGPSSSVYQLLRYQPAADTSATEVWAFSGTNSCHRLVSGTWSSVSLSDTVASVASSRPHGATFNGKLFLAYNSDVNRLHVWDGTTVRRVGIEASGAATVANTGSGSYTATIRYYKIQWKIVSGSNTVATSELSASVSFTPSGSGTAARVTKPTTPDSATHWVVFGSADNLTYYNVSGNIAVGTTTYDDSAAPSSYNSGAVAPTAGQSVPPPSCKYLLAGDNRLFMAGAWESSATSTQTGVRNSRVWFTAILGARDNTGEDEAIVQTTEIKHYVDVGENDGDAIVGLGGPLEGMVYVYKQRSIWRLTPTGLVDTPYRADQVSASTGAVWQDGIVMGETGSGQPALYFQSLSGPRRITAGGGVDDIGMDVRAQSATQVSIVNPEAILKWDPRRRILWAIYNDATTKTETYGTSTYAFQPEMEMAVGNGAYRGGWTSHVVTHGQFVTSAIYCAVVAELSGVMVPYLGGKYLTSDPVISTLSGTGTTDDGNGSMAGSILTRQYQPGNLRQACTVLPPTVEVLHRTGTATVAATVSITTATHSPVYSTQHTISGTTTASLTINGSHYAETVHAIQLSDVIGFTATINIPAENWSTVGRPGLVSVTLPYQLQEPL